MEHFNKLTPAEAERLSILVEKMGDALRAIGKIQRHGYQSRNPFIDEGTNRELLEKELGHVDAAIGALEKAADVSGTHIAKSTALKRKNIHHFQHHQEVSRG